MSYCQTLTYFSKLMAADGYGRAAELHIGSLLLNGANVYVKPTGDWSERDTNPAVYSLLHRKRRPTYWGVVHHFPPMDWHVADSRWNLGYSMVEGTRAPEWFVKAVNKYVVALLVPCQHNVDVMRDSGVKRPVHVVPHGLDKTYTWGDRTQGRPTTFGTLGTLTPRKGTDVLLRCFAAAFPRGDEDVRLEIKCRGPETASMIESARRDRRITIYGGEWTPAQTRGWYQSLTAYVSPTRGEGFGLTLCEAMLCGCAVIGTAWSACAEYLEDVYSYPLQITGLRPTVVDWPQGPDFGEWAVPDEDHLVDLLRQVAQDPIAARAKGKIASQAIASRFPHELPGRLTLDLLQQYGGLG